MPEKEPDRREPADQRHRALSRWDAEGGTELAGARKGSLSSAELPEIPQLTQAELVHLRIRVIALENMLISLLARAPRQQLELARELAAYILPRPGFTPHPLTIRAAHQMLDLIERAGHFSNAPSG